MKVHEYQAKEVLRHYLDSIPKGFLATTKEEASKLASSLDTSVWVVKAQIHAGGRGKGGGIKVVHDLASVAKAAEDLLGMKLITHQTGPEGNVVRKVYVEEGCDIARELYLSLTVDRAHGGIAIVASAEGGMDIEEVAATAPEKICIVNINPAIGLCNFQLRKLQQHLGITREDFSKFETLIRACYRAFMEKDMMQLEINPLVLDKKGRFVPLDAKVIFDENALYRRPDIAALEDVEEYEPTELRAKKAGLSYVQLQGNIGCMVNGAGLAMATMDLIGLRGGMPANFLDIGGTANHERVQTAFSILLSDKNVRGILVNIFGGIVRCDMIAESIIKTCQEQSINIPIVVRLEGSKSEVARSLIEEAKIKGLHFAEQLQEAAEKILALI